MTDEAKSALWFFGHAIGWLTAVTAFIGTVVAVCRAWGGWAALAYAVVVGAIASAVMLRLSREPKPKPPPEPMPDVCPKCKQRGAYR